MISLHSSASFASLSYTISQRQSVQLGGVAAPPYRLLNVPIFIPKWYYSAFACVHPVHSWLNDFFSRTSTRPTTQASPNMTSVPSAPAMAVAMPAELMPGIL